MAEAEDDKVVVIRGRCDVDGAVADKLTAEAGARLLTTADEVEEEGANMDVATAVDTSLLAGDWRGGGGGCVLSPIAAEVDMGATTTAAAVVPLATAPVVLLDGELVDDDDDDEAVAATTGEVITDSLANGLAVPRTTSDNLFSNFSPDVALFCNNTRNRIFFS